MWIAAIRMTVIPLVMSSLIVGVNRAPNPATIGRLGGRAITFFLVAPIIAPVLGTPMGPPLGPCPPCPRGAVAARRPAGSRGGAPPGSMPTVAQWFIDLVPLNP